ncbi:MAG: thiol:disulfide interchange protein [Ignavibacteria bacterium]|nr:MAG: thiol:disulfide interchange protein [Ignavibacteria bacterium]
MNHRIIVLSLSILAVSSCAEDYTSTDYLKRVVQKLEQIESATYWVQTENWNPGDTAASSTNNQYVESYRNPSDTTVGSSWAIFSNEDKARLVFAYDGTMRTIIYDDVKEVVIDSFNVRRMPFRPVSPPFFNYTEHIIKYILENNDSTLLEQKDLGEEIYLKLTILEDRQVEFFGKAHYMPANQYTYDPTSIYELWIDKKSNLPRKVRREMSHSITVRTVSNYDFNNLIIENFAATEYFPQGYEIRQYGQTGKRSRPDALLGKKAPEWTLQTNDKEEMSLSDLKSKVLMIQFTSVSCGPCKISIPFLKELSMEYEKKRFDFVSIECTSKNTDVLKSYMIRNDFDYTLLLSTKDVLDKYSITSYPVFFILDENRDVIKVIKGYRKETTDREIRALINTLI